MGLPIIKIITLFPMLLPLWEKRPLEETDTFPGDYPTAVAEQDVPRQRQGLKHGNRDLRGTIYRHLREMDLPASRKVLADSLATEQDARLVGTILQQLSFCTTMPDVDMKALDARLKDSDSDIRYWAIRLAGHIPKFPAKRLADLAANEPTSRLRLAAAQALQERGTRLRLTVLRPLWDHADPVVSAASLATALRVGGASGRAVRIPRKALAAAIPVRHALADAIDEAAPADAKSLVPRLAKDAHPSVRASLAQSLGKKADPAFLKTLLALTRDPDPEVRRQAAESLAPFPQPATRDALVALLGDPRTLVRREAEDSLVAIHPACPVDEAAGKRLPEGRAYTRYHVYRLLGRLNSRQFAQPIAQRLPRETRPVNIAAAVFALGCFDADFAADAINRLASHKDTGVRTDVARALGAIAVPNTYPTIQRLAFDKEEDVRHAAIIGMGWIADGKVFNPTLLKVLKTVNTDKMSGANHAAAAWAIGRTRPPSPALAKRLVVQATVPVIPGEMGEMLFEPDYVLGSCTFALAQMSRHDARFLPQFEQVMKIHGKVYAKGDFPTDGSLMPSAEVLEVARQARAYLGGTTLDPALRPTRWKSYQFGIFEARRP
ncbi:MAG: HEAT repeat domain-containing protein [Victivallales bacterium]|nr:HEAT repeat domain-containing protein [Victivallales bacterium]